MFSALADNSSDKLSNINVVEVDAGLAPITILRDFHPFPVRVKPEIVQFFVLCEKVLENLIEIHSICQI